MTERDLYLSFLSMSSNVILWMLGNGKAFSRDKFTPEEWTELFIKAFLELRKVVEEYEESPNEFHNLWDRIEIQFKSSEEKYLIAVFSPVPLDEPSQPLSVITNENMI